MLRRHYHPTVVELATKLASRETLAPRLVNTAPLTIMNTFSDAAGAFHPPPPPPKAHRLAAALAASAAKGTAPPMLGAVGSSTLEDVRQAVELARAAASQPVLHLFMSRTAP